MARLRLNNVSAEGTNTITFADGTTTTGTFASAPGFATIVAPDYYVIIVEPDTSNEEIVYLVGYTAAATTGTFVRAQEGTSGVAHASKIWVHGPTVADFGFSQSLNLLSADDASVEGSVGTHVARTNCSVAQSTAQAQDGTHSLALTSTAAGAMSESTATGVSGYPVTPGQTYSWMSSWRAAVATHDAAVLADSPSGYWKLNEASGTATADSSGEGNAGAMHGGITLGQPGPFGGTDTAFLLDGSTGYISGVMPAPSTAFSIEVWVDHNGAAWDAGYEILWSSADVASQAGTYLAVHNGVLEANLKVNGGFYTSTGGPSVPTSGWHQIGVSWASGGAPVLYLDGVAYTSTAGVLTGAMDSCASYNIGRYANGANDYLHGYVAQVALYPAALSTARMLAHTKNSSNSVRTDLAWYNAAGTLLSTSQGAQVTDATTGWTQSVGSAVAPAGAAFATVVGDVLSTAAAGEVHYEDQWAILPGPLGYELQVASDAPVGYWKLNDAVGAGTVADSSGQGDTGTIHGTVTFGQSGSLTTFPGETAAMFDGSTGYISVPDASALDLTAGGAGTVEALVYMTSYAGRTSAIAVKGQAAVAFPYGLICSSTGQPGFRENSDDRFSSGGTIPLNQWTRVAVTISAHSLTFYINGSQVGTATATDGITNEALPLYIGRTNGLSDFFTGSIAQVAVYNTALSAARVAAHDNASCFVGSQQFVNGWSPGGLSSGIETVLVAQQPADIPMVVSGTAGQTGHLAELRSSGGTVLVSFDSAGKVTSSSTVTAQELVTRTDKVSGALSTTASWVSGTGQQIDASYDRILSVSMVTTSSAGTCTVALSPDNVTYTTVATITPAVTAVTTPWTGYIPKGWYVKLTFSNATVAAGIYW